MHYASIRLSRGFQIKSHSQDLKYRRNPLSYSRRWQELLYVQTSRTHQEISSSFKLIFKLLHAKYELDHTV